MHRSFVSLVLFSAVLLFLNACSTTGTPPATPEQVEVSNISGLTGTYFDNTMFEGDPITRVDSEINFDWGNRAPIDGLGVSGYSVRWTGQVQPIATGNYTFSPATQGQTRLLVNGIVVARVNWDGETGQLIQPIDLEAGVKYDLTLEYKPSDTGDSAIRLEWQQGGEALSIVPSGQLSPTGSNVNNALNTLSNTTAFQDLGTAFDPQTAVGTLTPDGFGLTVKELGQSRAFIAILENDQTKLFIRYGEDEEGGELLNVLNGEVASLDPIGSYIDENGDYINADSFISQVGPILEEDTFGRYSTSSSAPDGEITIQTMQIDFNWSRNPCVGDCQDEWLSWNAATAGYAFNLIATISDVRNCIMTGSSCDALGFDLDETVTSREEEEQAKEDFQRCFYNSSVCPPKLTGPNLTKIDEYANVGEWVRYEITFGNDSSASGPLIYTYSGAHVQNGGGGKLTSGQTHTIYWYYECPETPITVTDTVLIETNDRARPSVSVPVTLECGVPDITEPTPNPLRLEAPINETATGSFSFGNGGTADLTYTVSPVSATLGYVVGPRSGAVTPSGQATIEVDAYCRDVAETRKFTVSITSNDPDEKVKIVEVELTCIGGPKLEVNPKTLSFTRRTDDVATIESFVATNVGNETLRIRSIRSYTSAGEDDVRVNGYKTFLQPGESTDVLLTVKCRRFGRFEREIKIYGADFAVLEVIPVTFNCRKPTRTHQIDYSSWGPTYYTEKGYCGSIANHYRPIYSGGKRYDEYSGWGSYCTGSRSETGLIMADEHRRFVDRNLHLIDDWVAKHPQYNVLDKWAEKDERDLLSALGGAYYYVLIEEKE